MFKKQRVRYGALLKQWPVVRWVGRGLVQTSLTACPDQASHGSCRSEVKSQKPLQQGKARRRLHELGDASLASWKWRAGGKC
jgi:hypothetical protein